jgi:hypothetical protein
MRKPALEAVCCGAFNRDLDIVPMRWVLGVSSPVIGNAGAAGERDAAVHD